MIHRLYANDKRFKSVQFKKGLNIVLADRQNDSGEKDSRNGIGKTTLINVLHFCLGSDLKKDLLPVDEIAEWIFFLDLDLCGEKFTASRSIENSSIISIAGNCSVLPIKPEKDEDKGVIFYKIADWRKLLGYCLFDLKDTMRNKYAPSFRTLISYFIRTGRDAYSKPFSYFKNQPSWQIQVSNAFLLGLNWEYASDVQILKDKNKAAKALDDAVKLGIASSKGELEAERVRLQGELEVEESSLSSFKVHPKYKEIQDNADESTKAIHSISNNNIILQKKLDRYKKSVQSEKVPDASTVTNLYEEAGLHFGETLKKSLDEAKKFHFDIIQNRKLFLQAEIEEIKNKINSNDKILEQKTLERAELLTILQTHGALDEFNILHKGVNEKRSRFEILKSKISDIQEMSKKKKEIKVERIEIDSKLQRDFEQSRSQWEKAIDGFNENSNALYNNPGDLIINTSDKGSVKENAYSFDVEIPRSSSEGVGKMKIFCYDLMLVNLFALREKIDFLVHDSTMFDGVDSRQIAHALEHANKKALETGFQYICAFNSDVIPCGDLSNDFDISDFVRLTLTDQNPSDSVLGFKFELNKKKKL